jgi:hypothetical protein
MDYSKIKERISELNKEIFELRSEALIDYVKTHGEKMNHFVDTLILKVTDFEINISADPSWDVVIDELYVNKAGKLCFRVYNESDNSIHIDREFKPSDSSIMEIFFSYLCK